MRNIKLIWDFKGSYANQTALHHKKHIQEFLHTTNFESIALETQQLSELHAIAYLVVSEKDMIPIRDALKPHRATVYP